jgi:hypothetical protein
VGLLDCARAASDGKDVLQSLLMALESWLLEFAGDHPEQLDVVLVEILRRSESAMLAAVVASAATAHPQTSGEAILVLLSAPDYITLDRGRIASEHPNLKIPGMYSPRQAENRIYEEERTRADHLPHRRQNLEDAIVRLQLGPLASRVHALLDRHKAELPAIEQQDNETRTWRLAMHRMDLRQYTLSEADVNETTKTAHHGSPESPQRLIRLDPREPEPDITEMMNESAVRFAATNAWLRLFHWAYKKFQGDTSAPCQPTIWPQLLSEAMTAQPDQVEMFEVCQICNVTGASDAPVLR